MNNDIRTQMQQREFEKLKHQHRVILKWATGCGKSKMVIDLINHAADKFIYERPMKILFVVAERAHIQNWDDEFDKWHLRRDLVATDVICYASLHKYKDFKYDVIVLDETHHAFTDKRMEYLEALAANLLLSSYVYLLSATLSSSKVDMAEEIFGKFTTSTVTLKDAIESDILPDPKVYVIEMNLDRKLANEEILIGKDKNAPLVSFDDRSRYVINNIPCRIRCTQHEKYIYYTTAMEYWKQRYEHSKNDFHRTKWVNFGSQRKRYLGKLKTAAVYTLLRRMPRNRRLVCFCASVNQAEMLSAKGTISSRKTPKHNQSIINAFNSKKISNIYAVGMITEGMNLTDIQTGIIVQLDGKERLFIQKVGRVLRADSPVCYIFYFKNTQDEVYLKQALENIDKKFVKFITVDQLNTIKL